MGKGHSGKLWACLVLGALAAALALSLFLPWFWRQREIRRFREGGYRGAFLAMYDISTYDEADFAAYRGVDVMKIGRPVKGWRTLSRYLGELLESPGTVTNLYLGLDPAALWEDAGRSEETWEKRLGETLLSRLSQNPDVSFEILLPAPPLPEWTALSREEMEERLAACGRLIRELDPYENVMLYFLGGEQWLIANPGNYLEDGQTNAWISHKILLLAFCDHEYQIVPGNAQILFDRLRAQVEQEKESPTVYPDLSDWCMVFFGDSTLANDRGSFSVPGVAAGLSGAQAYNCSMGGMPASETEDMPLSFNRMVDRFLKGDASGLEPDSVFAEGLKEYQEDGHRGKRYCFVVAFGLNDYFNGYSPDSGEDPCDIRTYEGALRVGVRTLRERFPEALILVMTPTYTEYFSGGTERNGSAGGVLTDYVEAARRVAREEAVLCMDNYAGLGIDGSNQSEYLADGCHLNERGRFLLGRRIVEYIGDL